MVRSGGTTAPYHSNSPTRSAMLWGGVGNYNNGAVSLRAKRSNLLAGIKNRLLHSHTLVRNDKKVVIPDTTDPEGQRTRTATLWGGARTVPVWYPGSYRERCGCEAPQGSKQPPPRRSKQITPHAIPQQNFVLRGWIGRFLQAGLISEEKQRRLLRGLEGPAACE
jgi:hypothetical protein